jgi:hypothetical protein
MVNVIALTDVALKQEGLHSNVPVKNIKIPDKVVSITRHDNNVFETVKKKK